MPKTSPLSLRLPPDLLNEIRREARRDDRPASQVIQRTLEEGIRMRRCPGIIFVDGPAGRRATIAGTGIDVWEVVRVLNACDGNLEALARALPHLSVPQLEGAVHYYRRYPREIEDRLELEEEASRDLLSHPLVRQIEV